MVVDLQKLALRMLADYDARTPGQFFGEPLDLATVQAYALQAEIARLREERGERVIGYKSLRWLGGRLAQFGLQLYKGQVILTGSPMKLYPAAPGCRIVVEAPPLGASCVEIDP